MIDHEVDELPVPAAPGIHVPQPLEDSRVGPVVHGSEVAVEQQLELGAVPTMPEEVLVVCV
jgi:hypothetical protein